MLNNNIQEYIQKLQEVADLMKKELPDVDWPRSQSATIKLALIYIETAIYGLKRSEDKK